MKTIAPKVIRPRELRFLSQSAPSGPFEPVGDWMPFVSAGVGLADHIAHNLPVRSVTGEPRYWLRSTGHDGFCEVR